MKHLIVFFIFIAPFSFSQNFSIEELIIPFEYHTQSYSASQVDLISEGWNNILTANVDYSAELPFSGTGKYLSAATFYKSKDNRFVEFISYPDGTFFFKEWADSVKSDLLHFGLAEKDSANLRVENTMISSVNGDDSLVTDSIYPFRKTGAWEFRMPNDSKLYGNYRNGKRIGTWTHYLDDYSSVGFLPVLAEFEYENGQLRSVKSVDKSTFDYEEKLKLLNGRWKVYPWDAKTTALCKENWCIYKFQKTGKGNVPVSGCITNHGPCAVGHTCKDQQWSLNKDNTVQIDGFLFKLLYLNEEHVMLKRVN